MSAFSRTQRAFSGRTDIWQYLGNGVSVSAEEAIRSAHERAQQAASWKAAQSVLKPAALAAAIQSETKNQAEILHDLIGNPFRLIVADPAWLDRKDGTVRLLAQMIYDEHLLDDLTSLSVALEEAGCRDAEILAHCRGPGPHVRGCWVVDLVLGNE